MQAKKKTNNGKKKCFKCGKFFRPDTIAEHIHLMHPHAIPNVPMADDDPPDQSAVGYLQRDLDDANEKYASMSREYSQEVKKAEAYRSGLFELAHVLASILDLERES